MYIEYSDILNQLYIALDSSVSVTPTVLSNLTVDVSGDTFDFVGGAPSVGDAITQAGYTYGIIDVTGSVIRIDKTGTNNKIVNGSANILHSDQYPKAIVENEIKIAMEFIDLQCRQWFEPRSKIFRLEGRNSNVMLFNIPIISMSEIRINSETVGADLRNFEIFDGVQNRRNPRVKLQTGFRNIYTSTYGRTFRRATYTEFEGMYGFVEEDGSTPLLIQKAMMILVVNAIKSSIVIDSALAGVGALKREKTDLHETEYFQPDEVRGGSSGALSGDIEVDRIIKMYRGPISIGGSIMDVSSVEAIDYGDYTY